jgi:flagellar basal-body rod protein FlgF
METPTYVTLSAQVALQRQLEVIANNVANASTTGYRADRQLFSTYVEQLPNAGDAVSFVQDRATYIDQTDGPIQPTGNPLDVAVHGGAYLAVTTPQGTTAYSRDGRMHLGTDGTLLDSKGNAVQSSDGQPIQLPDIYDNLVIRGDGSVTVTVNNRAQEVGQIGLFHATDQLSLRKSGDNMLTAPPGAMQPLDQGDPSARLVQGSLEGSTVQPVKEIANMTELSRAYDRLQTLLSDDNDRESKMIDALGHPS